MNGRHTRHIIPRDFWDVIMAASDEWYSAFQIQGRRTVRRVFWHDVMQPFFASLHAHRVAPCASLWEPE